MRLLLSRGTTQPLCQESAALDDREALEECLALQTGP